MSGERDLDGNSRGNDPVPTSTVAGSLERGGTDVLDEFFGRFSVTIPRWLFPMAKQRSRIRNHTVQRDDTRNPDLVRTRYSSHLLRRKIRNRWWCIRLECSFSVCLAEVCQRPQFVVRRAFQRDESVVGCGLGTEKFVELSLGYRLLSSLSVLECEHHHHRDG